MTVDFKEYSRRMDKALEHLDEEFASVRAGRAEREQGGSAQPIVTFADSLKKNIQIKPLP